MSFQVLIDDLLIGVAATEDEAEKLFEAWVVKRRDEAEAEAQRRVVVEYTRELMGMAAAGTLEPVDKDVIAARVDAAQKAFETKMTAQVMEWVIARRIIRS